MFRKLKIQLVMINLALIGVVLVVIFSGIYFSTRQGMERQTDNLMRRVAESERLPRPTLDQPPDQPPGQLQEQPPEQRTSPNILLYVKVNENGQVREISPNAPFSTGDIQSFTEVALARTDPGGTFRSGGIQFRYLKAPKGYGQILVLYDETPDAIVLNRLVADSLVIGGISLIMVFLVSLYLATLALVPIRRAWDKQKAFVADASHELRTPLAVVNTNLELVLENGDETVDSQSQWLGNIKSEIQRMSKLVSDLLFLARTDANEAMRVSAFHLSNALNQTVAPLIPLAALKGVELISNIEPEVIFDGNEGRLKQLATILLDNAIKHTAGGGKVELRLRSGQNTVEMTVSDTGEGIPEKHLGRIFERFYRIDESRSREYGGTGLGLSIADCIVKEHKGAMSASSVVGKGSVFKIVLPRPRRVS